MRSNCLLDHSLRHAERVELVYVAVQPRRDVEGVAVRSDRKDVRHAVKQAFRPEVEPEAGSLHTGIQFLPGGIRARSKTKLLMVPVEADVNPCVATIVKNESATFRIL